MNVRRTLAVLMVLVLVALLAWLGARAVLHEPARDAPETPPDGSQAPRAAPPGPRAERPRAPPAEPSPQRGGVDTSSSSPAVQPEAPAQSLIVQVLDVSGRPAAGARVAVYDVFVAAAGRLDDMVLAMGTTDGSGRIPFALRGASDLLVLASLPGESAAVKSSLFKTTEATAEIRLAPSSSIRGRVVFPDELPVAGAGVVAFLENRQGTLVLRAMSEADGRFVIEDVPADRLERRPLLRVLRGAGHWGIEMSASQEEARSGAVVVRVDRTTVVRGRCVDDKGLVIPHVRLTVYTEKWNWGAVSGADGRFEGEFPRGTGFIELASDETLESRIEPFVVDGAALDLGDVILPRGVAIRGVALDRDGRPAPRAVVQVSSTRRTRSARTDDEGRFAVDHLAPGTYDILVQAPTENEARGAPEADAGELLGVAAPTDGALVRLGGSRFVSIRVHWPDDRSSSFGFTLRVRGEDGRGPPDTTRHAGGPASDLIRFRVAKSGVYDLTLEHAHFHPVAFQAVRVEEGRETFLEATLRKQP